MAGLERQWTGVDRTADHEAWAARPGGQPVVAERDGQAAAAGTVGGAGTEFGHHPPGAAAGRGDAEARDAVLAVLASPGPARRPGPGLPARARTRRPGRCSRRAGATSDLDLYMATEPGLLDPRRAVPSPAMA